MYSSLNCVRFDLRQNDSSVMMTILTAPVLVMITVCSGGPTPTKKTITFQVAEQNARIEF